jgi:hypothetical protein
MLIAAVVADLARKDEQAQTAKSTEAWLLALRANLAAVESDTEEAFEARREFASLLVEKVIVGRDEEGRAKVDVTYRFGPPETGRGVVDSADGERNSEEFSKAHGRGGAGGLLRAHPKMTSYVIAVEREPEISGSA